MIFAARAAVALAALALLGGCGLQDEANEARGSRALHDRVQEIVDDARSQTASLVSPSLDQFEGAVVSRVPSEPDSYQLFIRPGDHDTRQVGIAIDGKLDGVGPGRETRSIRMCVVVTLTVRPGVAARIADTDCSGLPTRADVLPFDG